MLKYWLENEKLLHIPAMSEIPIGAACFRAMTSAPNISNLKGNFREWEIFPKLRNCGRVEEVAAEEVKKVAGRSAHQSLSFPRGESVNL